jgi:endonuclease/exonuclease/phosphatase family metal-dependent hydrolase
VPSYHVAFWNLENLFDVDHSTVRPDWLQQNLARELAGWDATILRRKIGRLASIIRQMNDGAGPDILCVCEVENERVLDLLAGALDLPGRSYRVAHADTEDQRGIDVAVFFDGALFEKREQFSRVILKRHATRDLFQVTLRMRASGREVILIGNHWPSRSGGLFESKPYRILAGETLAYWHERIRAIKGPDVPVLALGDFNDEPFDRSLVDYALSTRQRQKVQNARTPRFFNLMWPLLGERCGTHYFDGFANMLDQALASPALIRESSPLRLRPESVRIEAFPEMIERGDYPAPRRFGRPSDGGSFDPDGFSDHFPISLVLEED